MPDIIEAIHPTRMELLTMKKRIKLAEKGHRLLKEKRDVLVIEFFNTIESARTITEDLMDTMKASYENLIKTEAIMGPTEVESIALGVREMQDVKVDEENIMGVYIPKLRIDLPELERGYSPTFTSSILDETIHDFGEALKQIIAFAEAEESARRLSDEIKKTKRRVNALEYIVLPRLKNTQKYIQMRLEELERENFFRLKTMKRKRMKNAY